MRVAVAAAHIKALLALVALVAAVLAQDFRLSLRRLRELQTLEEVVVAVMQVATRRRLAAQASSSFHTQAQPNYLVVELLPNQAVTSFTHLQLLAHLALCHL
jgi:hypothetical protein